MKQVWIEVSVRTGSEGQSVRGRELLRFRDAEALAAGLETLPETIGRLLDRAGEERGQDAHATRGGEERGQDAGATRQTESAQAE